MHFSWQQIHVHLLRDCTTLGVQQTFKAMRRQHPTLSDFVDPASLLDTLHHGAASAAEKNEYLKALIEAAQADSTAADSALLMMLLVLWPGLDAVYWRSRRRGVGSGEEVASEVLVRATEVIRCLDLGRVRWIAATILQNIERDMIRAHRREVSVRKLNVGIDPDECAADSIVSEPETSLERLHREMVRIIGADALLVMRVAVEGGSQAEVGAEFGLTAAAARKRFQRALGRARDRLSAAA